MSKRRSRAGEVGKTHRVERRKQANRVTTVNPDEPEDEKSAEGRKPVTLPTVRWTKRPLPK